MSPAVKWDYPGPIPTLTHDDVRQGHELPLWGGTGNSLAAWGVPELCQRTNLEPPFHSFQFSLSGRSLTSPLALEVSESMKLVHNCSPFYN